jgi:molybdopterin biosynthesis enzyme
MRRPAVTERTVARPQRKYHRLSEYISFAIMIAGSRLRRGMSEANCFIVLEHARGKIEAGEPAQVRLFEGLV